MVIARCVWARGDGGPRSCKVVPTHLNTSRRPRLVLREQTHPELTGPHGALGLNGPSVEAAISPRKLWGVDFPFDEVTVAALVLQLFLSTSFTTSWLWLQGLLVRRGIGTYGGICPAHDPFMEGGWKRRKHSVGVGSEAHANRQQETEAQQTKREVTAWGH